MVYLFCSIWCVWDECGFDWSLLMMYGELCGSEWSYYEWVVGIISVVVIRVFFFVYDDFCFFFIFYYWLFLYVVCCNFIIIVYVFLCVYFGWEVVWEIWWGCEGVEVEVVYYIFVNLLDIVIYFVSVCRKVIIIDC